MRHAQVWLMVVLLMVACAPEPPATGGSFGTTTDGSGGTVSLDDQPAQTSACTLIGCADTVSFESAALIPGDLYTIELCRADVCTTTTTAAMVLDPTFVTDITEVDPNRIAGPYLSIGIGLLDVSDLVNLDISIEHVDTRSPVYVFSGGVAFEASYPNGVNCPPPCWSATIVF